MYDKKSKYSDMADESCHYCGGKGYLEIFNAYDPEFVQIEGCPRCALASSQKTAASSTLN